MTDPDNRQAGEIEVTPEMIAAGAKVLADALDLFLGSAEGVAEDVIRAALEARQLATAKSR